ncbi:MAG: (Fe-S)-binding protein [Armatimonadetes bacterium]|nr:(Fe-S)-binding protein [Armatimonadota bacterium]
MNLEPLIETTRAYSCISCAKCTGRCPLARASYELDRDGGYSPRAVVSKALQGEIDDHSGMIWDCLTCNACALKCPSDVDFPGFVRQARSKIRKERANGQVRLCTGGSQLSEIANLMAERDLQQKRMDWVGDLQVAVEGETLYFVGCLPYFDLVFPDVVHTQTIAQSMVKIMNAAGIAPVVLANEVCCGHDKLWTGEEDVFKALARKNAAMIQERGVKRIVTSCPECYRTLKLDYPEFVDFNVEVVHSSQFLSELISDGTIRFKDEPETERTVSYQDPCRLGKHMRVFQEPRDVINSIPGLRLEEMTETKAESACCGTSAFSGCDKVREKIRLDRLSQAKSTLVTACPKCQIHFKCTQHTNQTISPEVQGIEVKDLANLVAEAMEAHV